MEKYQCSCCIPPKIYSRSDKLSKHREKNDPSFINHFELLKQEKRAYEEKPNRCYCGAALSFKRRHQKFCSRSCSAHVNNTSRLKRPRLAKERYCKTCNVQLMTKQQRTYCSAACTYTDQKGKKVQAWLNGSLNPSHTNGELAPWAKRYLLEQADNKCSRCGWGEIHEITGRTTVQVDHIDGNFRNNSIDNLRVLCPNCHSLTLTYGNLNKGSGRRYRTQNTGLSSKGKT